MAGVARNWWAAGVLWVALGGSAWANCSVEDKTALAKSGYQKIEIEEMCSKGSALYEVKPGAAKTAVGDSAKNGRNCSYCLDMVEIPAGSFEMGDASGSADEKPVRKVTLAAFLVSKTEVTQAQWQAIMGRNLSRFVGCDNCPVENVSWEDIQEYLQYLGNKTGKPYRLLTEAEWEYACRAGGKHNYCGGNDLDRLAWTTASDSSPRTRPVGEKEANAFGLHDMSGNVWEWVEDCWKENYALAPTDGSAVTTGDCKRRILRGGSWLSDPASARSAKRFYLDSRTRGTNIGFRVAISLGKR